MNSNPSYTFFPLGDSAITVDYGNIIDESVNTKIIAVFNHLQKNPFPGMIESLPAFSSLTVYYDIAVIKKMPDKRSAYEQVKQKLEQELSYNFETSNIPSKIIRIPACYDTEFAPDLATISEMKKITVDEIIQLHITKKYRVYMLGFLPGFAYMGEVDERIAMPRLAQPRSKVAAGSIGIAGKQTGIYPLDSPGGWQIIGRTPLKLFEPLKEAPTLLRAGDEVQFDSISRDEFENYQARHS
jgi:inhibitor of KinA